MTKTQTAPRHTRRLTIRERIARRMIERRSRRDFDMAAAVAAANTEAI